MADLFLFGKMTVRDVEIVDYQPVAFHSFSFRTRSRNHGKSKEEKRQRMPLKFSTVAIIQASRGDSRLWSRHDRTTTSLVS
jgi:hypothetical protein